MGADTHSLDELIGVSRENYVYIRIQSEDGG